MAETVKSIWGIQALSMTIRPFVVPLGDGEVGPTEGTTIVDLRNGKLLARRFTGARWAEEILEIREIAGVPTLTVASN
jgi:hypothetical protein